MRFLLLALCWLGVAAQAQNTAPFATFHSASDPILNDPHDLAFGPDGRLYVADKFANNIKIMDPDTLQIVDSIGDNALPGVHDVSFGPDGRLYAAVTGLSGVAEYDLSGDVPEAKGLMTPFPRTEGVLAHSNGRLYVMASGAGVLVAIENGAVVAIAEGMPGAHDVAEAPDGSVWVANTGGRSLVRFDSDLVQTGKLDGPHLGLVGPRYMDFAPDGTLIVADQDAHRVLRIDPLDGALLGVIGTGSPGQGPGLLDDPEGVAVRGSEYFFADSDNNRIVKYVVVMN